MVLALRYDFVETRSSKIDGVGILRCDATIARVGVQTYYENGKQINEFRPPEQVKASADSFSEVPYTIEHPPEQVTADNSHKYLKGLTGVCTYDETAGLLNTRLTITDAAAVKAALTTHKFNSCGYLCDARDEPGVWVDEFGVQGPKGKAYKYDRIQYDIVGNHVSGVRNPRAGGVARNHIDSADDSPKIESIAYAVYRVDGDDNAVDAEAESTQQIDAESSDQIKTEVFNKDNLTNSIAPNGARDPTNKKDSMATTDSPPDSEKNMGKPMKLKIDDQTEFELEPWQHAAIASRFKSDAATIESLQKQLAAIQKQMDAMTKAEKIEAKEESNEDEDKMSSKSKKKMDSLGFTSFDELFSRLDAIGAEKDILQGEVDRLKTDAAQRFDSDEITKQVESRLATWEQVKAFLPENSRMDAKDNAIEMKRKAIAAVNPKLNLDGKNDNYIEAAFDTLLTLGVRSDSETKKAQSEESNKLDEAMTRAQICGDHQGDTANPSDRTDSVKNDATMVKVRNAYESAYKRRKSANGRYMNTEDN